MCLNRTSSIIDYILQGISMLWGPGLKFPYLPVICHLLHAYYTIHVFVCSFI